MNGDPFTFSDARRGRFSDPGWSDRPDYLANALLQSLMRPMAAPYTPGLMRTLVLSLVSFGVIPLLLLPGKLREFGARERDQLWHLAQWFRDQLGIEDDTLDPRTPMLDRVMHVLRIVSWTSALIALGSIVWYCLNGHDIFDLFFATYGFFSSRYHPNGAQDELLFTIWMPSLCVGYAAQWASVQVHQARVRDFLARFNSIAGQRGVKRMAPPPEVLGLRPIWLAGALGFMCFGVIWGVPLMLAGGAQTRYIWHRSRGLRAEFAQRMRDLLRQTRPMTRFNIPVNLRRKCPVEICQAPLPQVATFCPRCGTRVAAVDRVA